MKTILIANTKGGCAKTTTAIYLATALAHAHPSESVAVIDGDPQGTATEWALRAEEDGAPLPFDIDSANRSNLLRKIEKFDWVVIDTEPGEGKGFTDAALTIADVVIIPTRTTPADMDRMWATEAVTSKRATSIVLLTQSGTSNTTDRGNAFDALDAQGVSYFETYIPHRAEIGRTMGTVPGPNMHNYDVVLSELKEAMQW